METRIYDLKTEPSGSLYYGLIDSAMSFCALALVVVRPETVLTEAGQRVLDSLNPFVDYKVKSSRWPGTELLDAEADLFYCQLNQNSSQFIKSATDHLYGWCHPNLPEDLCLLRADREPWLVTIAHEHDGYLILTDLERQHLQLLLPALRITMA